MRLCVWLWNAFAPKWSPPIDEIEAMGLSTEENLDKICLYWPDLGVKGEDQWNDAAPPGPVRQSRETRNATRLADRQTFLEFVESVYNEAVAQDKEDEDFHSPMCHELGYFAKYAGVQDLDFCHSIICPFEPVSLRPPLHWF
ncbi:hypothetical protein MPDQ_001583 [Monascus purpureus]|uniref:Uncharacterized protein n=1 Tax=Monascus purpureus TaxID=5098 RepID=A0A507QR88_MONPU|nr:hypothetical protein MPDQ_001583 [Monascus purpureus]